jgi:hypothetical protein
MPKIPSPLLGNSASGSNAFGGLGSLLDSGSIDALRSYMIFELVNVSHTAPTIPQSAPVFPFMVMHVNPETLEETYTKLINRFVTRGGFVEQHWGEELDAISCSGSTGAFVTIRSGVSVLNRKAAIAYRKYLELVALYTNGGSVYDTRGNIVFHGGINLHYNSNIFTGYFENLNVSESADNPFTFRTDFAFKVKKSLRTVGR